MQGKADRFNLLSIVITSNRGNYTNKKFKSKGDENHAINKKRTKINKTS